MASRDVAYGIEVINQKCNQQFGKSGNHNEKKHKTKANRLNGSRIDVGGYGDDL